MLGHWNLGTAKLALRPSTQPLLRVLTRSAGCATCSANFAAQDSEAVLFAGTRGERIRHARALRGGVRPARRTGDPGTIRRDRSRASRPPVCSLSCRTGLGTRERCRSRSARAATPPIRRGKALVCAIGETSLWSDLFGTFRSKSTHVQPHRRIALQVEYSPTNHLVAGSMAYDLLAIDAFRVATRSLHLRCGITRTEYS